MFFSEKKFVDLLCLYIIPAGVFVWSLLLPNNYTFIVMGKISLWLFVFIMFIKPIAVISHNDFFNRRMHYRKQLGILTFWFFLFHALGLIYIMKLQLDYFFLIPHLFFSLIAGLGMLILTITSNKYSVKKLKKNWKRIQYLAYPTFVFTLVHVALAQDKMQIFYIITSLYIILKIFQFRIQKRKSLAQVESTAHL